MDSNVVGSDIKLQRAAQTEEVVGRGKKKGKETENSCGSGCIQKQMVFTVSPCKYNLSLILHRINHTERIKPMWNKPESLLHSNLFISANFICNVNDYYNWAGKLRI